MNPFILLMALGIWGMIFAPLLLGHKQIIDDAFPYYEHVKFYLDNLSSGIYPLWDPVRDFGVANEFYLRRIGEFNPAYLLIVLLQKLGCSFLIAHRLFLGGYFILGVCGFYAVAKRLFTKPLTHLFIAGAVIFSSLGALSFQSYLLLILVPQIWFMYFAIAFFQQPSKKFLLGAVFALMVIAITYIPYYFLVVMMSAFVVWVACIRKTDIAATSVIKKFFLKHKKFTLACVVLLAIGLIPGALWYMESSQGEMAVVYRHSGVETANAAALHINVVNEGGIIAPQVAQRMFFELDQSKMGYFYVPLFVWMVLLAGAFVRIDKAMVFFFSWGFLIYLIGVADGSPVHGFLYKHIPMFKYFRNLQFLLWLGVFPALVFFAGSVFEKLLAVNVSVKSRRWLYVVFILLVHTAFAGFCLSQKIWVIIPTTYAATSLSALFFIGVAFKDKPLILTALPLLLMAAMAAQSSSVLLHMVNNTPKEYSPCRYDSNYMEFTLPKSGNLANLFSDQVRLRDLNQPFYSTKQFQDLYQNMNRSSLTEYVKPRLLLYDVNQWKDATSPALLANALEQASIVSADSRQVKVKSFSANALSVATELNAESILVYNNVFHSKWRAYCDGKTIPMFRANYAFMGIRVPPGTHTITFIFGHPWRTGFSFLLLAIYSLTLASVIISVCYRRK